MNQVTVAVKSVRIGTVSICGKSSWELIDSLVNRLFQEYLMKVDPCTNLGLSSNSMASYQIGEEVVRRLGSGPGLATNSIFFCFLFVNKLKCLSFDSLLKRWN